MKVGLLLICFLLISCSELPVRGPASLAEEIEFGEVDTQKSVVKAFPPEIHKESIRYLFFLELKDSTGKLVDCDPEEITLKSKGQKVPFQIERSSRGKFYLTLQQPGHSAKLNLKVFVRNIALKQDVNLVFKKADRNKSWMKAVRTERNGIKLRLFLGDSKGKPVEIPSAPEIVLDGQAQIENMERVGDGTWEFDVVYPNFNQVIYVHVRAHGKYMPDMFRIQHIEK